MPVISTVYTPVNVAAFVDMGGSARLVRMRDAAISVIVCSGGIVCFMTVCIVVIFLSDILEWKKGK